MTTKSHRFYLLVTVALTTFACSASQATGSTDGSSPTTNLTKEAKTAFAAASAPAATPPSSAAAAPPSSAAAAPPSSTAAPAVAPAEAEPAAEKTKGELPSVKVANIGMHIGGGPNDAATKEPIRRSVEPHFDEFRRCFAAASDPKKGGDLGVDLRIDRRGGKAKVSHPRTAIKGKEFETCVVHVFEGIDFLKPKSGNTVVSYSLRFTP